MDCSLLVTVKTLCRYVLVMLNDVFYQICIISPIQFSMLNISNRGSSHMSILTPQRGCELKLPMQSLFKHVLVGLM